MATNGLRCLRAHITPTPSKESITGSVSVFPEKQPVHDYLRDPP